jgi:hypothetical protein
MLTRHIADDMRQEQTQYKNKWLESTDFSSGRGCGCGRGGSAAPIPHFVSSSINLCAKNLNCRTTILQFN